MRIYPVIDIRNGYAIRLRQGQMGDSEIYSHFPSKVAKSFENQGATFLHIVDLDGAVAGQSVNSDLIQEILNVVTIPVQLGGGIRSIKDIEYNLNLGVSRVIIGTKAVEDPAFIKEAINTFGADKILVGIDAKNGMVAIEGWGTMSTYNTMSLAKQMKENGVKTIIYTDIMKDGMFTGPSVQAAKEIKETTDLEVILSGGVSSLKDVEEVSNCNLDGIIVGKAIYENKIDLKSAIEIFEKGEIH